MIDIKKTKKQEFTFIIVSSDGYESQEDDLVKAQAIARNLVENGKESVMILKVLQAWEVFYPEEPEPEVTECDLGDISF